MPYSFNQVKDILLKVQSRAQSNPESVVDYIDGILSVIPESEPVDAPAIQPEQQPHQYTRPADSWIVQSPQYTGSDMNPCFTNSQQGIVPDTNMQVTTTSCGQMAQDTAKQFSVPKYHGLDF